MDGDGDETVPSCIVSEVYMSLIFYLVNILVKVTVEETNVESMDMTDADDTKTITLTRSKVYYIFFSFLKVCVGCMECDQCE